MPSHPAGMLAQPDQAPGAVLSTLGKQGAAISEQEHGKKKKSYQVTKSKIIKAPRIHVFHNQKGQLPHLLANRRDTFSLAMDFQALKSSEALGWGKGSTFKAPRWPCLFAPK